MKLMKRPRPRSLGPSKSGGLLRLRRERNSKNRLIEVDVLAHDHVSRQDEREIFAVFAEVGPRLGEEALILALAIVLSLDFVCLGFHFASPLTVDIGVRLPNPSSQRAERVRLGRKRAEAAFPARRLPRQKGVTEQRDGASLCTTADQEGHEASGQIFRQRNR